MSTNAHFTEVLLARGRAVKVLLLDVDGVLTDGGLLYSATGETLKRFNTLDGHGLKMLQSAGITAAVITGRDSEPLRARLAALGISHARYGIDDKLPAAQDILARLQLDWSQTAAMGDDWPDWPMMKDAALRCAPSNAHHEIMSRADFVTRSQGGHGAVREVCDLLLSATGHYQTIAAKYTL
jgi:3-deoxy-D-manno-octulosonate 8-phosphate phosphatase (KDO 8-P phosphatase)